MKNNIQRLIFFCLICMIHSFVTNKYMTCPIIGIKLGKKLSSVGVFYNGVYQQIKDKSGKTLIPSIVTFIRDKVYYRIEAKKHYLQFNSQHTINNVLSLIGKSYIEAYKQQVKDKLQYQIANFNNRPYIVIKNNNEVRYYTPEEVLSQFIKYLKQLAEKHLQRSIGSAYFAVPNELTYQQRQLIKKSASMVDVNAVGVVSEETAASALYSDRKDESKILVFNLGKDKVSSKILRYEDGVGEILAFEEKMQNGGDYYNRQILAYLIEKRQIFEFNEFDSLQLEKIQQAKILLSKQNSTKLSIYNIYQNTTIQVELTRQQFQKQNQKLFNQAIDCIRKSLQKANLTESNISQIILVGGSTKIPKIKQLIKSIFPYTHILSQGIDPQLVSQYGASLLGRQVCDDYGYEHQIDYYLRFLLNSLFVKIQNQKVQIIQGQNILPCSNSQAIKVKRNKQNIFSMKVGMTNNINQIQKTIGQFVIQDFQIFGDNEEVEMQVQFKVDKNYVLSIIISDKEFQKNYFRIDNIDLDVERKILDYTANQTLSKASK